MSKLYYSLLLMPLAISCDIEFVDSLSNRPPHAQTYVPPSLSLNEELFVREMNAIIAEVSHPLTSFEMNEFFFSAGHPFSRSKFVLLGENHVDYPGLVLQARALQARVGPRDLVLFEGNDSGKQLDCDQHVFNLYVVKKWNETGRDYDPGEKDKFGARLYPLFASTKSLLHLNQLNMHQATCVFWDNLAAHDISPQNHSMTTRNETMVDTMHTFNYRNYERVFVLAGRRHLPSGDLDAFRTLFYDNQMMLSYYGFGISPFELYGSSFALSRYYTTIDQNTSSLGSRLISTSSFGSTKRIFEFLQDYEYIELIPKALMKSNGSASQDLAGS